MACPAESIQARVTLSRERKLPVLGKVLVSQGDVVEPATVVAQAETVPGEPYVVDIFHGLGERLSPADVRSTLRRRIGDHVTAGETLAERQISRFSEIRRVHSPVAGTVEFISAANGRIMVREDPQSARPQVVVRVANDLGVSPGMIRMFMRFREGDEVHQGAALAAILDALGGIRYSYAPASGTISEVCHRTGNVTLLRPSRPASVRAYLRGRVERIIPDLGAIISGDAALIQGVFGVGYEASGQLRVLAASAADETKAQAIDENCRGRVIVSGAYISLAAMRRALDVGAAGIVTGGIDHLDLVRLVGREISAGISGQEDIALTVVVTEGFGRLPMDEATFGVLRANDGNEVSLNGSTQVRAGVIRPEVVIPCRGPVPESGPEQGDDLAIARARVRLLRKPYFGLTGTVVERPSELVRMESEVMLRAVVVELPDGRRVTVPEANIEPVR